MNLLGIMRDNIILSAMLVFVPVGIYADKNNWPESSIFLTNFFAIVHPVLLIQGWGGGWVVFVWGLVSFGSQAAHTFEGSFSAVSKPIFAGRTALLPSSIFICSSMLSSGAF